jgi:hypothetical protein
LPHVSDYFTEGNEHFLVMQYIEGGDASALLKRDGAFPVRDVLRWTDDLLDALEYLHSQEPPIIHRDLKPSNLKITPRGDIFLLDFGLAKLKKENTLTERSLFGYSRKYSPLEQIQGTGTDVRSDLFALGATVYHLLTGQPPLDAITRASAIISGNPDPLQPASEIDREIPVAVANVLHSAMALNAASRFVSANAMRQALRHAVAEMGENAAAAQNPPVEASTEANVLSYREVIAQAVKAGVPVPIADDAAQSSGNNEPAAASGGKILTYAEALKQALKHEAAPALPEKDISDHTPAVAAPPAEPIENIVIASPETMAVPVIYSPENEEFPALSAFAAGNAEVSVQTIENADFKERADQSVPDENDEPWEEEIPSTEVQATAAPKAPVAATAAAAGSVMNLNKTATINHATVAEPRARRSGLPLAALLALLAIVASASAFFIFRNRSSAEPVLTPEVSVETRPDVEQPEKVEETVGQTKIPDTLETENDEIVKTKSAPAKKTTEKTEVKAEKPLVVAEEVKEIEHRNPVRATETKRPARKPQATTGEKRERVVENEPAPDIESIFTGRPSWERDNRRRRREQRFENRDDWTEEEFREMRRQQRRERRRRNFPVPF